MSIRWLPVLRIWRGVGYGNAWSKRGISWGYPDSRHFEAVFSHRGLPWTSGASVYVGDRVRKPEDQTRYRPENIRILGRIRLIPASAGFLWFPAFPYRAGVGYGKPGLKRGIPRLYSDCRDIYPILTSSGLRGRPVRPYMSMVE